MKIRLTDIEKSFAGKQVIRPVSITIESGSFTTLLGPSGCGKTTLLRMIAGLETPDAGEIWFDETCVFSKKEGIDLPPEKRGLGFVFQDFALWPHMTVFENVAFGLRARRQTDGLKERVERALAAVQLEEFAGRYPHQLSGGQQQRVAFARAIVIEPSCILFDEPLSALDALLREEMRYELKKLVSERNITSVFVTHDQTEAMSMSDKIAVLNAGVVDQYDAPEEIYAHPQTQFVAHFVGKSNWLNETQLFRPENSSEEKKQGCREFYLPIESVQYLGDSYEIFLRYDMETPPRCASEAGRAANEKKASLLDGAKEDMKSRTHMDDTQQQKGNTGRIVL
ncbi:MAG: ABC transporter ATP-binding protein, partial [Lachnospiraceae bacterium]|nr:ABC transporter ATP-binding protein [Lachnospiraceae bacterium]